MERIRVLVAEMPKMLGEIVARLIDEQEDMETVPSHLSGEALMDRLETSEPKVLLVSCTRAEARSRAQTILECRPDVRVIALTANGREATLYEMRPYAKSMGSVSPHTLIDAIREAAKC